MRIPKRYGDKLTTDCFFCKAGQATTKNKLGIPVCEKHRHEETPILKCICGKEVEIQTGKYATLIALFKEKMKNNEPLTIVSPGTQKRNFTHIDDIINGLVLVGENGYGDEFGIGSGEAFSIKEMAEMFDGKIQMLPERQGNRMTADVVTAKTEALGWKPTRTIKDYIEESRKNNWRQ